MTMEFNRGQFESAARFAAFVIVDPCKDCLSFGLGPDRSVPAGIVSNARRALAHARSLGLPVALVRSQGNQAAWLKGFEPRREDAVLLRTAPSCYSNLFFDETVQSAAGHIVLCGFPGRGGCIATVSGAIHAGHSVTVLRDATLDDAADPVAGSLLRHLTSYVDFEVAAISTSAWISSEGVPELRGK